MKVKDFVTINSGFFSKMKYDFKLCTNEDLDISFFCNWGEREIFAPFATLELERLSNLILSKFQAKWTRIIDLYQMEYDILYNYSDTYKETIEDIDDTTSESDITKSGTDRDVLTAEIKNDITSHNTSKNNSNYTDSFAGFNSTEAQLSSSKDGDNALEENGTNNTKKNTTQNVEHVIDNSVNSSSELNKKYKRTKETSHIGNIGNITNQSIIQQEKELRKWNVINEILEDVKEMILLSIYIKED